MIHSPKATPPEADTAPARMGWLDICRGLAILAVLFIHVSGHFLPALHPPKSLLPPSMTWHLLAVANLDAQWAVPCFLMLSAFVNALSLSRSPDIPRYARRRLTGAVLPYVLWSGVYVAVNTVLGHAPSLHPLHLVKLLLTGGAEFHLYFFVLVIELYLLLPLLTPLFARKPPFWAVAVSAVVLQAAVYCLNRFVLLHRFQSTILWDILPVALGLWLFSQAERRPEIFRRGLWAGVLVTAAGLAVYTPLAVATLLPHAQINTAVYQAGQWIFTAGMSFLIPALADALGSGRGGRLATVLAFLGSESLVIYVMHPLAIITLDRWGVNKTVGAGLGLFLYYMACLCLPLAAGELWKRSKNAFSSALSPVAGRE